MELTLQGKSLVFAKNALFKAKYNAQFLSNEICSLKQPLLRRLYLNCRIVKFEDFEKKKRFFHSLTFSRYKQFGIKEALSFGFAKSSKYKPIFPLSQIPKLLVACVTGGLFLSKLRLNRKFFTLLLAKPNFQVSDFWFVIFNLLFF